MWGLTEVTWALAALIGIWGMVGFVPHLFRPQRRAAWWFALAVVLLLAQAGARSLYWDGLDIFLGREEATAWRLAMNGTAVNWTFNLLAIAAGFALLKLLHLLIPQEDRHLYSPWTAPIYPARPNLSPFIGYLREIWRGRRR